MMHNDISFKQLLKITPLIFGYTYSTKSIGKTMASSSSSSHFVPTSASQLWKHEVFLSFRGEDTRKNFVDHLYAALEQQGIQTYKDDETLDRGERVGPTLFKAIQESQIAVIVFSKNYADSSWCLDELAHIMECLDTRGQIVMPIFYHVDPSDVRKLKRKYEEAFSKHDKENKQKVESWRKALKRAGNVSGWVINDTENSHEAKCIKDIVCTISGRLSPLTTNVNKDLIGIETRLQDLKSMLEVGSGGVRMVGIWGVGGGGKTTLASAAYMEISHHFDAQCLLQNVREESSNRGLEKLQENFLSRVLKTKVIVGSLSEGKSMIKRRLCHKSVLVVLDDIDDHKQLEALAGSHDWFGKGSRIIITTRDKHLLTRRTNMIYEVSLLSHEEATELFYRYSYRKDKPIEDYEKLSQDVVSYAGGLPLALEILGSFLYDKDKDEWKCALAKLKDIPDDKVMNTLRISYDGLNLEEKELFLDIACFLRRQRIDDTMMVLDACSFYPRIGVKVLVQKSLIKVSTGFFEMHDLIEEMAHCIVRDDPKKHSRIWKAKDIEKLCAEEATASLIEIEVLSCDIRDVSRLPDVIANMKNLRCIDLRFYPDSPFPSSFQPTNLLYLRLIGSMQKELWQGYKLLPQLKFLDLGYLMDLIKTPDFDGLPCLERLKIVRCRSLEEIHPSIGYHETLLWVTIVSCSRLETFPPIIRMKKLETLILSVCCRLQKFPDIRSNMDSLVNLRLNYLSTIEVIPSSVGQFCTNLVCFDIKMCEKLKRIDVEFRLLKSLKTLTICRCSQLLSQHSTSFNNLTRCITLQSSLQDEPLTLKLPQNPRLLRKLIVISSDLGDGDILSNIGELSNLQVLDLSNNRFSRLHSSILRIPRLKFLDLSYCKSLVELPNLPSSIAILKAEYCDSLESIGDLLNYKCLWKVSLRQSYKFIDGERVLHSMLQRNAVEDRFMSVALPTGGMNSRQRNAVEDRFMSVALPTGGTTTYGTKTLMTLQLPHSWCSDFSGFFLSADALKSGRCTIVIKQVMLSKDSQPDYDHWKEFDKHLESYEGYVGYVPFTSLRHTSWWNPTYTDISFQIEGMINPNVRLVPRVSKIDDLSERPIECWDEEYEDEKTFKIIDDLTSSNIQIEWDHDMDDVFEKIKY